MDESNLREYTFNEILESLFNIRQDYVDDCIDIIKSKDSTKKILTKEERNALNIYEKLYKNLGSVPSIDLFKESCSNFLVESGFKTKDILGVIRLFIKQRENSLTSKAIIDEATKVASNGVTSTISKNISNMLISDSVSIKYENICDKIIEIYESDFDNLGIKTGIEPIDKVIGGFRRGQVSVIAGFTGMGKSICSVSVMHSALEQGYNVCYISLELSAEHLMYNLISRHSLETKFTTKVEHRNLKFRNLSEKDWNYVRDTILPDLRSLPGKFYILDEQDIESYNAFSFDSKLQEIENLAIAETGKGLDLIIVDHIQMMAYSDDGSENTVINRWCNYFRQQCLDFLKTKRQIHVTLVSQINRQGYLKAVKNNGMYDMTALKEANELETCASVILGVFSDTSGIASNQTKVGILKNRDGSRSGDAYIVSANYPYQLIGGIGSTISSVMSSASISAFDTMMDDFDYLSSDFSLQIGGLGITGVDVDSDSFVQNDEFGISRLSREDSILEGDL